MVKTHPALHDVTVYTNEDGFPIRVLLDDKDVMAKSVTLDFVAHEFPEVTFTVVAKFDIIQPANMAE